MKHYKLLISLLFALNLIIFTGFSSLLSAQTSVSKTPSNRNFVIEKGTGVTCSSCPTIDSFCEAAIASHPGRGYLIMYHVGPDARPQIGLADYTNPYADSLYNTLPFTYNMMVNRKDQGLPYGYTYIYNQVQGGADAQVAEASPLNLAINLSYDKNNRLLTVNTEGYYTDNSPTTLNFLNLALVEDSLISKQTDSRVSGLWVNNYNHMNVFRTFLTGQWGDTISTTTKGTTFSKTYQYNIPTKFKDKNCRLIFFVTEEKHATAPQAKAGKTITASEASVGQAMLSVANQLGNPYMSIFPNPSNGVITITSDKTDLGLVEIYNMEGQKIYIKSLSQAASHDVDLSSQPEGIYIIKISNNEGMYIKKTVLTH